jgi:transposase
VLQLAQEKKLLRGKTVAVDATTLEANAAMRAIVRKDTGEDYQAYLKRLLAEQGVENPTAEEVRRFDRNRPKKGSNKEWESATDPDSRIAKMKDGTTHLAYKAEHVVDLDSGLVLAAEVYPADEADGDTLRPSVGSAQDHLALADTEAEVQEAVADKGYHQAEMLADCAEDGLRTYIPEQERPQPRVWQGKPAGWERAYRNNRRRVRGPRGKRLQRLRGEYVERSFAHVCDSGGARRSWLRGLVEVCKRYLLQAAGYNLGVIMRKLFGVGKPRALQGAWAALGGRIKAWMSAAVKNRYCHTVSPLEESGPEDLSPSIGFTAVQ